MIAFAVTPEEYEAIRKISQFVKPGSIVGYLTDFGLKLEYAADSLQESGIVKVLKRIGITKYFTLCAGRQRGGYLYGFENGIRDSEVQFVVVQKESPELLSFRAEFCYPENHGGKSGEYHYLCSGFYKNKSFSFRVLAKSDNSIVEPIVIYHNSNISKSNAVEIVKAELM